MLNAPAPFPRKTLILLAFMRVTIKSSLPSLFMSARANESTRDADETSPSSPTRRNPLFPSFRRTMDLASVISLEDTQYVKTMSGNPSLLISPVAIIGRRCPAVSVYVSELPSTLFCVAFVTVTWAVPCTLKDPFALARSVGLSNGMVYDPSLPRMRTSGAPGVSPSK